VENAARPGLRISVDIVSAIPVGDQELSRGLVLAVEGMLKEMRLKVTKEGRTDISSFISNRGIPALSVGIAAGREGRVQDTITIDSIEKGRELLSALIGSLDEEKL
jgi:putative aminopeptidase FrvX